MKKFTYLLYNIILYLFKLNFKIKFFYKISKWDIKLLSI